MSDRTIYIKDSTARKLEQIPVDDVYNNSEVLIAKRIEKIGRKYKRRMMFVVLCFFCIAAFATLRYSEIYEQTKKINVLSAECNDMQNTNIRLAADIENMMDLEKIKTLAEDKLSMYKPGKNQYIYIRLPQDDYVKGSKDVKNGKDVKDVKDIKGTNDVKKEGFINLLKSIITAGNR